MQFLKETQQSIKTKKIHFHIFVKIYKNTNMYFFGEEEISLHDFLWFYGSIGFMVGLFLLVQISSV